MPHVTKQSRMKKSAVIDENLLVSLNHKSWAKVLCLASRTLLSFHTPFEIMGEGLLHAKYVANLSLG